MKLSDSKTFQTKRSKSKKRLIIFIVIVVIAILGVAGYFLYKNMQVSEIRSTIDYGPASDSQKKNGEATKEATLNNKDGTNGSNSGSPINSSATITLSRVSQPAAGQPVSVRTKVDGMTTGKCRITFSLGGQPSVVKELDIVSGATYYTCTPIDIPVSEFSSSGDWSVSAIVTSASSNTATSQVSIQR